MKTTTFFTFLLFGSCLAVPALAAFQQETFKSPADASQALFSAVTERNIPALNKMFGKSFMDKINSGDPVADDLRRQQLSEMMKDGWKIVDLESGAKAIEVGHNNWPFPAPLIEQDGKWRFDSRAGAQEVINRRIGENEIRAIKLAQFFVEAEKLYRSKDRTGQGRVFARKFLSSPGKKDGLYWPAEVSGEEASPFGPLIGRAVEEGYKAQQKAGDGLYQGYRYRILTKQGPAAPGGPKSYLSSSGEMTEGFALLAYPARWGVSGVMSFIVSSEGRVYERDLGKDTQQAVSTIVAFNPDPAWKSAHAY